PPGLEERCPERWQEAEPSGVIGREQRRGALEQAASRRRVAAQQRLLPAGLEPRFRFSGERSFMLTYESELVAAAIRLLQVIADDLVLAVIVECERVGEPLVELCAKLLRQPAVGRVLDQHVVEAEGVLAREGGRIRLDQLSSHERHQMLAE